MWSHAVRTVSGSPAARTYGGDPVEVLVAEESGFVRDPLTRPASAAETAGRVAPAWERAGGCRGQGWDRESRGSVVGLWEQRTEALAYRRLGMVRS
jgi:hypothetical protein